MQKLPSFNNPDKGAPKVGMDKGEQAPPGKYIFAFKSMKFRVSQNKAARTEGHLQIINEYTVVRCLAGGEPCPDWKGNVRTQFPGVTRSFTIDLQQHDGAQGQHNEVSLYFHGINAKDPAELREIGVVANLTGTMTQDQQKAEIVRAAGAMDSVIHNCMDEANPLLGVRFACEIKDVTKSGPQGTRTFAAHMVSLCTDPEDLAHNATILGGDDAPAPAAT